MKNSNKALVALLILGILHTPRSQCDLTCLQPSSVPSGRHGPILTFEGASKKAHFKDIVGHKKAAQYYECRKLYADIGRILKEPDYITCGARECPGTQRLAKLCSSLPNTSPDEKKVREAVARYIAPLPCAPISKKPEEKTPATPPMPTRQIPESAEDENLRLLNKELEKKLEEKDRALDEQRRTIDDLTKKLAESTLQQKTNEAQSEAQQNKLELSIKNMEQQLRDIINKISNFTKSYLAVEQASDDYATMKSATKTQDKKYHDAVDQLKATWKTYQKELKALNDQLKHAASFLKITLPDDKPVPEDMHLTLTVESILRFEGRPSTLN